MPRGRVRLALIGSVRTAQLPHRAAMPQAQAEQVVDALSGSVAADLEEAAGALTSCSDSQLVASLDPAASHAEGDGGAPDAPTLPLHHLHHPAAGSATAAARAAMPSDLIAAALPRRSLLPISLSPAGGQRLPVSTAICRIRSCCCLSRRRCSAQCGVSAHSGPGTRGTAADHAAPPGLALRIPPCVAPCAAGARRCPRALCPICFVALCYHVQFQIQWA